MDISISIDAIGEKHDVIVEKIIGDKNPNYGYDARKCEYGDLIKLGVIDPKKVTRVALENAASVAGLLLTTEVIIAEEHNLEEEAMKDVIRRNQGLPNN